MKGLSVIIAAFILVFGTVTSRAANLERISAQTGIPVATLQAERTSTGLGWGELENAHLLANALAANGSNLTFNDLVAMHQAGEGWGKIAHDNGVNLGRIVSSAHRSSQATMHAQNLSTVHRKSTAVGGRSAATDHGKSATTVHGKRTTNIGRGHAPRMTATRGVGHGSSSRSGFSGSHGMRSMSHFGSSRMGSMGHMGGHHGR
jgi:hypothetical protein